MSAPRKAKPKVRPIKPQPDELLEEKGFPRNMDAERFVLGCILIDSGLFGEAAGLRPDDFTLERHREIFAAMCVLHASEEHIDRVTVAEELARCNRLGTDGISYLADLDEGMPRLPHIDSYVRILRKKATLRRAIIAAEKLKGEALLETAEPAEIFESHFADLQKLREQAAGPGVTSVDDLDSIFTDTAPIEYLVEPELPAGAVVYLAGDSESGKSTLGCAWGRDLIGKGHAFLLLDGDKNPRRVIRERFERLGMSDHPRLRIWDAQQSQEPPQPDSPVIVEWVKRMLGETGRAPLVVVDSLISFLREGENENESVHMRSLFDRCRALTLLGATVVLIHHVGKNGEARGSSDFRPAADQGFLVTNYNPDGTRLLSKITLKVTKSRYGLTTDVLYNYAGGRFVRDQSHTAVVETAGEHLTSLLRMNPGIITSTFYKLATKQGIAEAKARTWLADGVLAGTIERKTGPNRSQQHFLVADDPQSSFESGVVRASAE